MHVKKVTIIGAGIAGLEIARVLDTQGVEVTLVETKPQAGGNVANWDRLFPNQRKASEVLQPLLQTKPVTTRLINEVQVDKVMAADKVYSLTLSSGERLNADAVVLASGFRPFKARRKEEYGYGIYDNVITSVDLERMFNEDKVLTTKNTIPGRIAFVHCVGSRDEKVGNTYCSKLCCVTAVKQAIEMKECYPSAEVFCLYMDLRMYDRHFEDLYRTAQEKHHINFIRGRLSEAAEGHDGRLQIKTEDTLMGKPLKLSVDMLVLMVGMEPSEQASQLSTLFGVEQGSDGFFNGLDEHARFNCTKQDGLFLAGTCRGPKNITETMADARSAAEAVMAYLDKV